MNSKFFDYSNRRSTNTKILVDLLVNVLHSFLSNWTIHLSFSYCFTVTYILLHVLKFSLLYNVYNKTFLENI